MQKEFPDFFSNFRPEISLRIFLDFFLEFSRFVSWETETTKNSPTIPAIFQCKIPRQIRRKKSPKVFWRAGKLTVQSETGRIRFRRVTVSNTDLSESFCPHRVPGRELSEFLSAYCLCAKVNSPSFSQNSPSLPQNSVRLSEFSSPKQYSGNGIPLPFPIQRRVRKMSVFVFIP